MTRGAKVIRRRDVTEVSGPYFPGLHWQHTRGSALLGLVHAAAAYLSRLITSANRAQPAAARPAPQRTA